MALIEVALQVLLWAMMMCPAQPPLDIHVVYVDFRMSFALISFVSCPVEYIALSDEVTFAAALRFLFGENALTKQ